MLNRVLDKQIPEAASHVFTTIIGPEHIDLSYVRNVRNELCCGKSYVALVFHEFVKCQNIRSFLLQFVYNNNNNNSSNIQHLYIAL